MTQLKVASYDPRVHLLALSDLGPEVGPELTPATHLSRLHDETSDSPLAAMLGHPDLDLNGVEVFEVADVQGLGLNAYLAEAYDIPAATLAPDAPRLGALEGTVVVLTPRALGRLALSLDLPPSLTLIGSWAPATADNAPRPTPQVDLAPQRVAEPHSRAPRLPGWMVLLILLVAAGLTWLALA